MLPFTLQQLQILKSLALEKNFTKGAKNINISQPSLSKQMKKLELNLDMPLIVRDENELVLTDAGKILFTYAERILSLCEESCRALTELKNGYRGNLAIGLSETIGAAFLPNLLSKFKSNYPEIQLKFYMFSTELIVEKIFRHEIDLAMVGDQLSNKAKQNLRIQEYFNDRKRPFPSKFSIIKFMNT